MLFRSVIFRALLVSLNSQSDIGALVGFGLDIEVGLGETLGVAFDDGERVVVGEGDGVGEADLIGMGIGAACFIVTPASQTNLLPLFTHVNFLPL